MDTAPAENLRARVRGQLLLPADEGYDAGRKIYNAMIDKRPAMILRCAGAADVIAAISFAQEQNLLVSIRSGGHGIAGKAICDGGLVIDLSRMKGIRVDPEKRTVRAEPGLTLGEFDRETQGFDLATTLGSRPPLALQG
jgi:FAD/FMN-containing dehydrogenase